MQFSVTYRDDAAPPHAARKPGAADREIIDIPYRVIDETHIDRQYFSRKSSVAKTNRFGVHSALKKKLTIESDGPTSGPLPRAAAGEPDYELIELMYFAYRDLVAEPDHLLENLGLGRAHHRVLHFVNRRRGLTIAELLDTLKITKQSLNRVLNDLLDQNYVVARTGATDRRQRRLFPTLRGEALALTLAHLQSRRFARSFARLPRGARTAAREFLLAIIESGEQDDGRAAEGAPAGF
jgi:DNA-binding MarR family transcriptional regulator